METPQLKDIQGVLINGYTRLDYCNYLFLRIKKASLFLNWLKDQQFQDASEKPSEACQNIAFSSKGLQNLGLEIKESNGFSIDFIQGMNSTHKNRILGDVDQNDPINWFWGNDSQPAHVILMQFATTAKEAEKMKLNISDNSNEFGISVIHVINSEKLAQSKEHFGFRDGLSQPDIKYVKDKGNPENTLNPGEFILGYDNAYHVKPLSPNFEEFDFGKNGSYMVVRQLEQNVRKFWDTLLDYENGDLEKTIELASKMVGRWPNGNSLVNHNKANEKVDEGKQNNFMFFQEDKHGYKCPIGSHIRRSNPRDGLDGKPKESIDMVNKHRILRRGRPYGPPLVASMNTEDILTSTDDEQERGLMFICFNSDISRQFEFVQHTWANNRKFDGLYNDVDAIMGVQGNLASGKMETTQFEIQSCPVRKRYTNIPTFVTVKGGEYFFLPGINSIRYICKNL